MNDSASVPVDCAARRHRRRRSGADRGAVCVSEIYYVNIASQILLYAVFALGLNVLVGYAGLVSLGHAGLFGIAAYVVAYLLAAGHGHTVAILAALAAGLVATAGFAALSLRATGISFIMITLALGEIIWGLAYRWISITNGDNGISVPARARRRSACRSPRRAASTTRR